MNLARRSVRRIAFDTEQEFGVNQYSLESRLDSFLEAPLPAAKLVEVEQRLDVFSRHRPPISATRQRGENLPGALFLVVAVAARRAAHKNPASAGCLSRPFGVVGSADRDAAHGRISVRVAIIQSVGIVGDRRQKHTFRVHGFVQEGGPKQARARPCLEADFQVSVRCAHVFILRPLAVLGPRYISCCRLAIERAAHCEQLDSFPIQPDVELVRLAEAENVIISISLQADSDGVLGIEREVMANRDSATRPEREPFAHALLLHEVPGNIVSLKGRTGGGVSNGEAADLS